MRVYPELTVDGEFKALGDLGHTGALNDRQFSFLRNQGYTNGLADMFFQYRSWTPTQLFTTAGSRGFFYDFSDYSTQFTDTAGTTAITGVGQSLARVNDKSGLGNHATQATAGSRPLTQVRPMGVTPRNLLEQTNDFTVSPWAEAVLGTSTRANTTSTYGFGLGLVTVTSANGGIRQTRTGLTSGQPYTLSFYLESATANINVVLENGAAGFGATHVASIDPSTGVFSGVSGFTSTTSAVFGTGRIYTLITAPAGGTLTANIEWRVTAASGTFLLGRTQFERGSAATAYQPTGPALINGEKRNLLTFTEQFDNAAWTKVNVTATANDAVAPNETTTADVVAATANGQAYIRQNATVTANTPYTVSIYLKAGNVSWCLFEVWNSGVTKWSGRYINLATGAFGGTTSGGGGLGGVFAVTNIGSGWYRVSVTATSDNTVLTPALYAADGDGDINVLAGNNILIWGAQLELGPTATAYQRVVSTDEWYEPGFTSYRGIRFDGSDDFLQTAAIDFSNSDKMTVVAGVRKLNDADAALVELTASTNVNNGAFGLFANAPVGPGIYQVLSRGTTLAARNLTQVAPDTAVLTALCDISAPSLALKRNGITVTTAASQGTGNFANDIVYIGRRGGTTLPFNGILTFLCVINRTLTASELAQLEAFANGKTGAY